LTSGVYLGQVLPTITQDADNVAIDGLYTIYKWTDHAATGSYEISSTVSHEWLVVAGGGAGGGSQGGGGGAGGYRAGASLSLTGGNEYTITVGDGGQAADESGDNSIIAGTGITTITSTGGGGGGDYPSTNGKVGGSGGGGGVQGGMTGGAATSITQYTAAGEVTSVQGYAGGAGMNGSPWDGGGGGGAGEAGNTNSTGHGGDGVQNDITGTNLYYAGGGGAAYNSSNPGGSGGGGQGSVSGNNGSTAGTDGLGGGGGGDFDNTGTGGSGVVMLRKLTLAGGTAGADLTLQSTDTTASTANPDYADMIVLMENSEGTATLNTDIKGYISEDSGSTFTQGTLVDEGSWGTDKKIIAFHDLDISAQSGSAMCYKITTHNQSAGSKETNIHATSIGWR